MLRCLIVDDDVHCRNILKGMLSETFSQLVEPIFEAKSVSEALRMVEIVKPEIVFLDVELEDGSGFDFLEKATYRNFKIIFTTAHETYALKAFKVSAVDYLLKPFSPAELQSAVQKITDQPVLKSMGDEMQLLMDYMNGNRSKIAIPVQTGFEFILVNDIIRLEAEGNYTKFYMRNGKTYLVSKTLKIYEGLFENDGFCRVHASHLVNLKEIKQYTKGEGGYLIMTDGSKVEVSRSKREEFISRLRV